LVLADTGRIALVGNSNRGLVAGTGGDALQTVSVIDTAAALAHRPTLVGTVPAGLFPRDLSTDPATGQVLMANFSSVMPMPPTMSSTPIRFNNTLGRYRTGMPATCPPPLNRQCDWTAPGLRRPRFT
jgi:hypothetical protein